MSFFAPPKEIPNRVIATVPAKLRKQGDARHKRFDARGFHTLQDCFLEGPCFDRQGRFHCVDMYSGRLLRLSDKNEFEVVVEYKGHPNGMKVHKDGRLIVADRKLGLLAVDPESGEVSSMLDEAQTKKLKGLNDVVFADNGDCYFTDFEGASLQTPNGSVYRQSAAGKLECLIDNIPGPNGIVLNSTGTAILVAATFANSVWRCPLNDNGSTGKVGAFVNLSGGVGPDGLAVDEDGNLVIAHAGMGRVWVVSVVGEPLWIIKAERGGFLTNIAYGGPDRRTLYMTNSDTGEILAADMPIPGRKMYAHLD